MAFFLHFSSFALFINQFALVPFHAASENFLLECLTREGIFVIRYAAKNLFCI